MSKQDYLLRRGTEARADDHPFTTELPTADTIADTAVDIIVEVWSALLDWDVEPADDFFDIGGYSLLVAKAVTESQRRGVAVEVTDIFVHRTPLAIATAVAARRQADR